MRVNWLKGLLRVWLVITAIWFVAVIFIEQPIYYTKQYVFLSNFLNGNIHKTLSEIEFNGSEIEFKIPTSEESTVIVAGTSAEMITAKITAIKNGSLRKLIWSLAFALVPPASLLVLGMIVRWVLAGFAHESRRP